MFLKCQKGILKPAFIQEFFGCAIYET